MAELAHAEAAAEKRKLADDMKSETMNLMKQFMAEKSADEREMRKLVANIVADRDKIGESRNRLKELKQEIVKKVSAESKELLARALEEAEKEMKRRAELIAHIRALESVPLIHQKLFDRTETPGHGILDEMSVAELEERIALMKIERERERMEKQDLIIQEKRQRQEMLTEALDQIARHRMARSRIAAAAKIREA